LRFALPPEKKCPNPPTRVYNTNESLLVDTSLIWKLFNYGHVFKKNSQRRTTLFFSKLSAGTGFAVKHSSPSLIGRRKGKQHASNEEVRFTGYLLSVAGI
jgi:hypothetical protein